MENYKKRHGNKDLKEEIQLCLFDPPYNWEMGVHDNISVLEMEQLCNVAQYILKPGGTILIFSLVLQIHEYVQMLKNLNFSIELN